MTMLKLSPQKEAFVLLCIFQLEIIIKNVIVIFIGPNSLYQMVGRNKLHYITLHTCNVKMQLQKTFNLYDCFRSNYRLPSTRAHRILIYHRIKEPKIIFCLKKVSFTCTLSLGVNFIVAFFCIVVLSMQIGHIVVDTLNLFFTAATRVSM